jgi:hypothetical protein
MEVFLTKSLSGLIPADQPTAEWMGKLKIGESVHGNFKRYRNIGLHRKWFALLNVAFDNWNPGEIDSKYGMPEKNFDRFRADVTILAGYYETTIRLDGSVRVEPKSVSFASMSQEEFESLYSKTIDVLLKHVYGQGMTPEELNQIVERYLSFA